jgi:hypothetical protein
VSDAGYRNQSYILINSSEEVMSRAQRDPENKTETAVFINPESQPKFCLNNFRDRDPTRCPGWTFLFNLASFFFFGFKGHREKKLFL